LQTMPMRLKGFIWVTLLVAMSLRLARAEMVYVVVPTNAAPRVMFGAEKVMAALKLVNREAVVTVAPAAPGGRVLVNRWPDRTLSKEGFSFALGDNNDVSISAADDSGALYGCLELADRIRKAGKLPTTDIVLFRDAPKMTLRGVCVGMQKTFILPGRKVYEYPYTPELFPWFYDRQLWTEYLDFLVVNRVNSLYLWSGHPFASLVKLPDYPEAVEVSPEVFAKNQEMYRWLAAECDRRGIWLVQMFYNIFLPKPLADKYGVATQLAAPTPLAADYTRKSIAEFVKTYPNVGLMICLGEALQGTSNQLAWATQTILPGVHDGMCAAGLTAEPPVVIRTHAMDAPVIMPACFQVYSNLFTETKYNGESLTTWEPRGKSQAIHQAMAKLGPHLVNVHILSDLEPFRYGATEFIRKSVLASRDRLGASGVHLYPLSYWNWPYSPDLTDPSLKQWDRDWMWFEAWARYAWNPDVSAVADRAYWIGRLTEYYGNVQAAEKILNAVNAAGEVAPRLIRRFGITEGNRQTLSLGMTLDQLVNPQKYGAIEDLWLSQAPPGERLDEFMRKEWNHEAHAGETPVSILEETKIFAQLAVAEMQAAGTLVSRHRDEYERWLNDVKCISRLNEFYTFKVQAAQWTLRHGYSHAVHDLEQAEACLHSSLNAYEQLAVLTQTTYRFANSMQTSQRKIPFVGGKNGVGTNYLWSQLVPLYQQEYADFQAKVVQAKVGADAATSVDTVIKPWPVASFKLISTNAESYEVRLGARPFADREYTITGLAPELVGLTGIRFSHEAAKNGRYTPVEFETSEPVQVLVGYFNDQREIWLPVPKLEFAAQADERGGVEVLLQNAATISECPGVEIHAFRYEAGRHRLELLGKGSFVVLGVVPQSAKLEKRDARVGIP
jgi:hypothetical protein